MTEMMAVLIYNDGFRIQTITYTLGDSGFFQTSRYQGIVKSTVSGVFEDLKFKISEGYKKN